MSHQETFQTTRPFPVTIVIWLGLILTIARIWESWVLFPLVEFGTIFEIDLRWRFGAAAVWAVLLAWFTIALWFERLYAYRILPILFLLHTLYQIGWRYVAQSRPLNWFSPAYIGLVLMALSLYILMVHAPNKSAS